MPRGQHYTPERRRKIKEGALPLLRQGMTQKDVARKFKTTVSTLRSIIKDESYPGQRKGKQTKHSNPLSALSMDNPVVQLALKQQRLQEIEKEQKALAEEVITLKKDMKALHAQVGKTIAD